MKKLTSIITLLILFLAPGVGQEISKEQFTIPLTHPGEPGRLECSLVNGSITITGYAGKEVNIVATMPMKKVEISEESDKSGLKKVTSHSLSLAAEEENNTVEINSKSWKSAIHLDIKVPTNFSLDISTVNHGDILVENVEGMLDVRNVNGNITLNNVSGSVITNTTNGYVKVTMNRVESDKPMSFASWNGDVDVTLPPSVKASLKMKSSWGDVYTDFDIDFEQKKSKMGEQEKEGVYKVSVDEYLYGQLNGGGTEFTFKTGTGDIYLRKK